MSPPLSALLVVALAVSLVVAGYVVRRWRHARVLAALPIRIHVGGTRGKSATTRLIAAMLRAAGVTTIAKTTGTEPRLILGNGEERRWRRFGSASISEQWRFMREARALGARAIVLECMAVRPELVRASERLIVQATIAVITNARADHLEEADAEAALVEIVPLEGVVVASDEALSEALMRAIAARGARLESVATHALAPDTANRAIAARVCELVGVAVANDVEASPDPGAFFVKELEVDGKRLRFANAFACNDAVSLDRLLATVATPDEPLVVALNHRNDRPLRSMQFLDYLAARPVRPGLVLIDSTAWLRRAARKRGFAFSVLPATRDAQVLLRSLATLVPAGGAVWGIANYHGAGAAIAQAVLER